MRIQEVAHRTWPECYSVGYRRDIVRQKLTIAYRKPTLENSINLTVQVDMHFLAYKDILVSLC